MGSFLLAKENKYAEENNIFIEDISKRMFNYGLVMGILSDGKYHSVKEITFRTGLKIYEILGFMTGRQYRVNDIEINRRDFDKTMLRLIK